MLRSKLDAFIKSTQVLSPTNEYHLPDYIFPLHFVTVYDDLVMTGGEKLYVIRRGDSTLLKEVSLPDSGWCCLIIGDTLIIGGIYFIEMYSLPSVTRIKQNILMKSWVYKLL